MEPGGGSVTRFSGPVIRQLSYIIVLVFFVALGSGCGFEPGGSGPSVLSAAPSDVVPAAASTIVNGASIGELEQLMLERINRARIKSGPEAASDGITVNEGLPNVLIDDHPRAPVDFSTTLARGARTHADDML